jgi:hypothetical protein
MTVHSAFSTTCWEEILLVSHNIKMLYQSLPSVPILMTFWISYQQEAAVDEQVVLILAVCGAIQAIRADTVAIRGENRKIPELIC